MIDGFLSYPDVMDFMSSPVTFLSDDGIGDDDDGAENGDDLLALEAALNVEALNLGVNAEEVQSFTPIPTNTSPDTSQGGQFYNTASAVLSQRGMGADGDGDRGSDDDEEKKDEEENEEEGEEEEEDDVKASIKSHQDPDVEEEEEEQESSEEEQESSEEEQENSFSPVESFQDLDARFNEVGSLTIRAVRGQYVDEVFIVRSVQVSRRSTGRHSVTCIAQDGGTRTTSFYDVNDFEVAN